MSDLHAASALSDAAALWIRAGLYVFPCCPNTKKPLVKSWRQPSYGETLHESWRGHTHAMPGLDCESAGIIVVDCDRRPGKDGEKAFRGLCREVGVTLDDVPQVKTPSGGVHFYFKADPSFPISNSASVLASGVDVRGHGGFVVAAGAIRADGARYLPYNSPTIDAFIQKVAAQDLALFPASLRVRLSAGRPNNVVSLRGEELILHNSADPDRSGRSNSPWTLDEACARIAAAPEGTRNDTLTREAFIAGMRAAAGTFTLEEASTRLSDAGHHAGLSCDEINKTVSSALERGSRVSSGTIKFDRTGSGAIRKCFSNAMTAVTELGVSARRNTFSDKIVLGNAAGSSILPSEHEGLLIDNALSLIRSRIQELFGFDAGKDHLLDGIKAIAEDARFDPVNDWLDSLHWDGVRRLSTWLPKVTGAPATPPFEAAGEALILSMVMRPRFPGSKVDLCLVLEGDQGCGKSSFARALPSGPGEAYFSDAPGLIAMDNKTRGEILAGKWLVELAELSGMARSETEGVKAFLSQSSDQYRPAYATVAVDRHRTCVFLATTNAAAYLTDASGNRRFLPVPCKAIDLDAFLRDRDQLFAEGVNMVNAATASQQGVKRGHPLPHAVAMRLGLDHKHWAAAAALTDARRVTDPVEDVLPEVVQSMESSAKTLPNGKKFIPSSGLLMNLRTTLNMTVRNNGLAGWMKALGWSAAKMGSGAQQVRGYAK